MTKENKESTQKMCIAVNEAVLDEDGNYQPFYVKEGEDGYFPTDFHWGKDFSIAKRCAREYNEKIGINEKEAITLVLKSMGY